ncbi:MAG: thioredoxin family protein [Chitinophagaceae bacterium]|nr:MAG: thioredoxin family protein [Chitinophagaceae bacterium]
MEINRLKRSDFKKYMDTGVDYATYRQQVAAELVLNEDPVVQGYIEMNQIRMYRIEKTYMVSAELVEKVKRLPHKVYWLVLTESWCGDASQILPVLNKVAVISEGKIEMKLVYRDKNPELMDAFLTNQTRSIPKLIQLDTNFQLTGIWGPRPNEAQQLVKKLKSDPKTANDYSKALHLWYAKDQQRSLELDISKLLVRTNIYCTDCLS